MDAVLADRIMSMETRQWRDFLCQKPIPSGADEDGQAVVRAVLRRFTREHLDNAGPHNQRFDFQDLNVYLRLSCRLIPAEGRAARMLDIADVEVAPAARGKGVFTLLLSAVEGEAFALGYGVYVESILNPILKDALARRGYMIETKAAGCEIWDALLTPEQTSLRAAQLRPASD
ncbi:hypothetical protein [Geopseudomonas aromaticivorans]